MISLAGTLRAVELPSTRAVGADIDGATVIATGQLVHPAGESLHYHGRPIDLVLAPDGKTLFVKDSLSILAIDPVQWKILDQMKYPKKSGASLHGISLSHDGKHIYVTAVGSTLLDVAFDAQNHLSVARRISLKVPGTEKNPRADDSYPCGIALSADDKTAYVCLNVANELAVVDLEAGKIVRRITTGLGPYDVVLSPDGNTAYVSNWAGRVATSGDKTAKSGGSDVVTDDRGVASTGSVSVINFATDKPIVEIQTGLHPSALALSKDGKRLYVTNANSDSVTVIDTEALKAVREISVCPDPKLPFGSLPNALLLWQDEKTLYVADGGNNAIAVIDLNHEPNAPAGFIPTAWFPSAIASDGRNLYIANAKGEGSRDPDMAGKFNSHSYWATISKLPAPDSATLAKYSRQVNADAQVPQILAAQERSQSEVKPVPIPARLGEPSLFKHVVYIIKENRTYDQVLGDDSRGNGDSSLCTFGKTITPNHHALADQFVLLDNYYCNGVVSADGHAWVTQGIANDYLERSFGGWIRSYPFPGDDPMAFASSGFIWNDVIAHGLAFRNFGEMTTTHLDERTTWLAMYRDYQKKAGKVRHTNMTANADLRRFSNPESPGWNLRVTDQLRADVFLDGLAQFEKEKSFPNLVTLFLPCDHTSGTSPSAPTPGAMLADNDLALGRVVEGIAKSSFWKDTVIFVMEDDPQAGFDHVDGHRSVCLVVSPYTKRHAVVSNFYNQTSVLHTIEMILGLPPMTQMDAMSPVMRECFVDEADDSPYVCLKNNIPLDQMNPPKTALIGKALELAKLSEQQNWALPDQANEDQLNRILWHSMKGVDARYPAEFAGAHGKGLAKLHLKLNGTVQRDDDDD